MLVLNNYSCLYFSDINNTFSLSLDVRSNTKKISTLFHGYSNSNDVNMTWIQFLLDTSNNIAVVQYRSTSLTLQESRFDLPSPSHKSWKKFTLSLMKDVNTGNSTVSFQISCDQPQLTEVTEGINLILPRDLIIEIGGNSIGPETAFTVSSFTLTLSGGKFQLILFSYTSIRALIAATVF